MTAGASLRSWRDDIHTRWRMFSFDIVALGAKTDLGQFSAYFTYES
jgi:hypothetical protein